MTSAAQLYADAVAALNRSDWAHAYGLAAQVLAQAPDNPGVVFVAGVAALHQGRLTLAVEHLRRASVLDPTRADYPAQLARALAAMRLTREALQAADRASALAPQDPQTLNTLGVVYTQANEHHQAMVVLRRAATLEPDHANYRFNLASVLTFLGQLDEAETEYEACLRLDPALWKAHLALSQLRRQTPSTDHVQRLLAALTRAADDPQALLYLNLALAKEYEDLGRYPQAFDHLEAGKSSHRKIRKYSFARDEAMFDALIRATTPPESAVEPSEQSIGDPAREPIFVIGMPRTGTTLVERILSSHPQVHSAGELQNFGIAFKRASGSRTPSVLDPDSIARARDIDWTRLGAEYLASTRPGTGRTPHFIDKLPHNFLYAGFIARALPRASIICLRRDPMDTCLSNFRQLFALSSTYYDYSFDLLDIGRYYLQFERLMAHWRQVLPGRILEIDYESIVDAQEASTSRLLEHCGLPWDRACLSFQDNAAAVATASTVQVREPIYRSAVNRWKNYESQLAGLRELLGDAVRD